MIIAKKEHPKGRFDILKFYNMLFLQFSFYNFVVQQFGTLCTAWFSTSKRRAVKLAIFLKTQNVNDKNGQNIMYSF
jgi:hypothetical protein